MLTLSVYTPVLGMLVLGMFLDVLPSMSAWAADLCTGHTHRERLHPGRLRKVRRHDSCGRHGQPDGGVIGGRRGVVGW